VTCVGSRPFLDGSAGLGAGGVGHDGAVLGQEVPERVFDDGGDGVLADFEQTARARLPRTASACASAASRELKTSVLFDRWPSYVQYPATKPGFWLTPGTMRSPRNCSC
jgi:hypothetical protein